MSRDPADYYTTPSWCVRRLLEAWWAPCIDYWVEPSAGNGAIIRAVNAVRSDVQWLASEIRPEERDALALVDHCRVEICDFLHAEPFSYAARDVRVVLGNPPYSLAEEFVHRAMLLYPRAEIVFLLRIAFLSSKERAPFMREHPPDVYVLPDRPSFIGSGGDNADYAWFRWPIDSEATLARLPRPAGELRVLVPTPLAERKLDRGHDVMLEPAQTSLF